MAALAQPDARPDAADRPGLPRRPDASSEIQGACALRSVVPGPDPGARRDRGGGCARRACPRTPEACTQLKRSGFSDERLARARPAWRGARSRPAAPARASGRCSSGSIPAPPSSRPCTPYLYSATRRGIVGDPAASARAGRPTGAGDHPGRRARTGSARASSSTIAAATPRSALREAGLRGDHGQLQPRDRQHRLRHLRPPLFRAADGRGRAQDLREAQRGEPLGVIVQFGGQTPLNLSHALEAAGVPIIGTTPGASTSPRTASGSSAARSARPASSRPTPRPRATRGAADAERIGYPAGGPPQLRARRPGHGDRLRDRRAATATWPRPSARPSIGPILIDKFLEDAIEVDVDAVCDGTTVVVAGVMEHIEEAGIHSGDSACSLPPYSPGAAIVRRDQAADVRAGAGAQGPRTDERPVRGQGRRGLRAGGQSARLPHRSVRRQGDRRTRWRRSRRGSWRASAGDGFTVRAAARGFVSVKEAVFPFAKFPGVDMCSARRCGRPAR